MSEMIIGRNACLEALSSGRDLEKVLVRDSKGRKADGSIQKIVAQAKDRGIPVEFRDRQILDRMASGAVHQGVIAFGADFSYSSVEEILALAEQRQEKPFLVLLDGIEDPHNLGAIIRTAECAGAHGVIIPKNRAASVNETVMKTSAGAAEHVLCARVTNLGRTIDELKDHGVWIYGCDMGENLCWDTDLTGPAAVVIGNEGSGVSRLVREKCDFIVSIPLMGRIDSLNASNAAAVIMYEAVRQRREG